jgi:hypothetical protein
VASEDTKGVCVCVWIRTISEQDKNKTPMAGGSSVVQCLPSIHEVLHSTSSTAKTSKLSLFFFFKSTSSYLKASQCCVGYGLLDLVYGYRILYSLEYILQISKK